MQLTPVYPSIHTHSHSLNLSKVSAVYVRLQDPGQSLGFIPKSIPERQEPKFGLISKLFASRLKKSTHCKNCGTIVSNSYIKKQYIDTFRAIT